ncbi:hypothetical protein HGO40_11220 [Pseudomonas sp. CG7]|uniref:hypothetical protein n=1 Tax=Pseudomonas sp. CG7 TaxID=191007 RepID=UPI002033BFDC|nr:hypothetical protein [Pseudomonas sp. CG7]MCM2461050.1 hypothetical protein [Pseudomonas sp. CG7]
MALNKPYLQLRREPERGCGPTQEGVDLMRRGGAGACEALLKYLNSINRIENIITTGLKNHD